MHETWLIAGALLVAAAVLGAIVAVSQWRAKRRTPVDEATDWKLDRAHNYARETCLWLRFIGVHLIVTTVVGAILLTISA